MANIVTDVRCISGTLHNILRDVDCATNSIGEETTQDTGTSCTCSGASGSGSGSTNESESGSGSGNSGPIDYGDCEHCEPANSVPSSYSFDMSGFVNSPTGLDAEGNAAPCPEVPETLNFGVVTLTRVGPCTFRYTNGTVQLQLILESPTSQNLIYFDTVTSCSFAWIVSDFTCCGGGTTAQGSTISGMFGVGATIPTPNLVPSEDGCPCQIYLGSLSTEGGAQKLLIRVGTTDVWEAVGESYTWRLTRTGPLTWTFDVYNHVGGGLPPGTLCYFWSTDSWDGTGTGFFTHDGEGCETTVTIECGNGTCCEFPTSVGESGSSFLGELLGTTEFGSEGGFTETITWVDGFSGSCTISVTGSALCSDFTASLEFYCEDGVWYLDVSVAGDPGYSLTRHPYSSIQCPYTEPTEEDMSITWELPGFDVLCPEQTVTFVLTYDWEK